MSANINNITLWKTYLARIAAGLTGILVLSVFFYGVFLLIAVAHTAARTTAQKQISDITARLGDLETQYLAETKNLTPERATELGFTTPVSVSAVFATAGARSLSLKSNQ